MNAEQFDEMMREWVSRNVVIKCEREYGRYPDPDFMFVKLLVTDSTGKSCCVSEDSFRID
jgi:hypothetical protein